MSFWDICIYYLRDGRAVIWLLCEWSHPFLDVGVVRLFHLTRLVVNDGDARTKGGRTKTKQIIGMLRLSDGNYMY